MSMYTTNISEEECIGDSLTTINANFSALDTQVTNLYYSPIATYVCERNGTGIINQFMGYGASANLHDGTCMPYPGYMFAAALQAVGITGTVSVDPCINGTANTDYRLTTTGTNLTGNVISKYSEPLTFNAGDRLGWKQTLVPTSANAYNVTYMVVFNIA